MTSPIFRDFLPLPSPLSLILINKAYGLTSPYGRSPSPYVADIIVIGAKLHLHYSVRPYSWSFVKRRVLENSGIGARAIL